MFIKFNFLAGFSDAGTSLCTLPPHSPGTLENKAQTPLEGLFLSIINRYFYYFLFNIFIKIIINDFL